MTTPSARWDSAYRDHLPPWDTGRPQPAFVRLADRGLLAGRERAQVVPGWADGQSEGLPEVVEVVVVGVASQGAAGDVLEAGVPQAAGDVAVGGAGHGGLAGRGRLNLPGRGPEDLQHGHAAASDVPHAGRDGAAGAGNPGHLQDGPAGVAQKADDQAGQDRVEVRSRPGQLFGHSGAYVGAGVAVVAGGGELRGGVDRGDVARAQTASQFPGQAARPATDIEDPHARLDAGGIGQRGGQDGGVAAHEAVVVLGRRPELRRGLCLHVCRAQHGHMEIR